jgi:hypothetical protein
MMMMMNVIGLMELVVWLASCRQNQKRKTKSGSNRCRGCDFGSRFSGANSVAICRSIYLLLELPVDSSSMATDKMNRV